MNSVVFSIFKEKEIIFNKYVIVFTFNIYSFHWSYFNLSIFIIFIYRLIFWFGICEQRIILKLIKYVLIFFDNCLFGQFINFMKWISPHTLFF